MCSDFRQRIYSSLLNKPQIVHSADNIDLQFRIPLSNGDQSAFRVLSYVYNCPAFSIQV
jgi:hypothetical protein